MKYTVFLAILFFGIACQNSSKDVNSLSEIDKGFGQILDNISSRKEAVMTVMENQISISSSRAYKKKQVESIVEKADSAVSFLEQQKSKDFLEAIRKFRDEIIKVNKSDGDKSNDFLIKHYQEAFEIYSTDSLSKQSEGNSKMVTLTHSKLLQVKIRNAELDALNSTVILGVRNGAILDLLSAEVILDEKEFKTNETVSGRIVLTGNSSMFPNKFHLGEVDSVKYMKSSKGFGSLMIPFGNTTATTGIKENVSDFEVGRKGEFHLVKMNAGRYKIEGAVEVISTIGRYFFPFEKKYTVKSN